MTKINLLPWREQRQHEQQRQLLFLGSSYLVLIILLALLWYSWLAYRIAKTTANNALLQQQITKSQSHLQQKQQLQIQDQKSMQLMQQVAVIMTEQRQLENFLQTFPKIMPATIYLRQINRSGQELMLTGSAASLIAVNDFLQALNSKLGEAQLIMVSEDKGSGEILFKLKIMLALKNIEDGHR